MERDSARGRTSVDSSPAGGDSPSRVTRLRMDEVQAQDGEQDRGLDHEEHIAFGERLRQVPGKYGVTLLMIEHDLDLVRSVCSEITVLNFGEVLASGSQEEVLSNPEVLKAYMGETEML